MAEIKYLQVFPDYIFLSFPFFNNHITLAKYSSIAIKTCLKRIETKQDKPDKRDETKYSYKDLFKKD